VSGYSDIEEVADKLERAMSNNAGRFPNARSLEDAVDYMRWCVRFDLGLTSEPYLCDTSLLGQPLSKNGNDINRSHTPSEVLAFRTASKFLAEVMRGQETEHAWLYVNMNEGYEVLLLNSNLRE
jgi:hypothetical protein